MKTQGTTLECFMDLMERLEPDLHEKRRILAQVLGVEDATVRRWATGGGHPIGMPMLSLWYYLDYLGYRIDELVPLSSLFRDAGRLLAFRVITLEEMAKLTGHDGYSDKVIAVLRGTRGISAEREEQFREVVETYRQELTDKLQAIPKLVTVNRTPEFGGSFIAAAPVVAKSVPAPPPKAGSGTRREERFKGLALNLLDFARFYTDPTVPEEVRDQLRSVVGQQNIFDLKNLLSRLCSSKAFSNQQ